MAIGTTKQPLYFLNHDIKTYVAEQTHNGASTLLHCMQWRHSLNRPRPSHPCPSSCGSFPLEGRKETLPKNKLPQSQIFSKRKYVSFCPTFCGSSKPNFLSAVQCLVCEAWRVLACFKKWIFLSQLRQSMYESEKPRKPHVPLIFLKLLLLSLFSNLNPIFVPMFIENVSADDSLPETKHVHTCAMKIQKSFKFV